MDVAGSISGDETAVAVVAGPDWEGHYELVELASWALRDTMESKGRAVAIAKKWRATLKIDVIGLGQALYDSVVQDGVVEVARYRATDRPTDPDRFTNAKAADAWFLRGLLETGKIRLPRDQRLAAQLAAVRYKIDPAGRIRIVDPADSPDLVDALVIGVSPPRVGIASCDFPWL